MAINRSNGDLKTTWCSIVRIIWAETSQTKRDKANTAVCIEERMD